ncbi:Pesticin receptor [Massilia sp. Bi118]|uniref:TonB-dependent receptor n=1 Tax=Massilia sp. Bi118 TaxID=2822346 RepID=UPI001E09287F|nr:TonB-dependent receptor [Massilia sp. Bi118]CAH0282226.1 Pesticin receptor [Massilia sp. Bi118]
MKNTACAGRRTLTPIQLAILTFCAGFNAAAHAQSAEPSAPAAQASDSGKIAEVIVTATKRSTSLQKTPIAITALNAQTLEDNHVQTLLDVVNLVPGFQATGQGDHGVTTMTLRGIGNDSAKTEYADPEVATFVDGIYSPRPEGATALLFDLDAIEVLRGPQGTLWGRNSTVGAVNMQTAKPVLGSKSGSVEAGLGDYRRYGARGAFNIPLGETAALRIAAVHEQHDGYVDYQAFNVPSLADQRAAWKASGGADAAFQPINPNLFVRTGPKYSAQDQTAARISFLWQPSSQLRWNIAYERFTDRGTPSMNLMQTPRAGQDFWSALIDTAPTLKRDSDSVRSRLEYQLNPDMQLTYIAGWSKFDGSSTFDQDAGADLPTSFSTGGNHQENNTVYSHYTNYSHEVELQSLGSREIDWQLGLYYGAEDNGIRFDIPIMNGTQQGTVGWQGSFIQPKETVKSSAAFGQATWNLANNLHLTGGARYTHDKRTNEGGNGYTWDSKAVVPQVPLSPNIDPTKPGQGYNPNVPSNTGEFNGHKWTGLLRLGYDIDRYNMVYASLSTGYKSGGLQDGGRPYFDETLTNYEVGSKSSFMGGKLLVNNAIFFEKFRGFQFSSPITNADGTRGLATENADGAKIYGLESEITARITPDDRMMLALTFTPHAKLGKLTGGSNDYTLPPCPATNGTTTCLDVTGHSMPHTPKFMAQLQYQHVFRLGEGTTLAPRISAHYETESTLSVFDLGAEDRQKAYGRADVGLRYTRDKWWLDLFVRNVSDEKIKTSAFNPGPHAIWLAQYQPPRTIGFNTGIDF